MPWVPFADSSISGWAFEVEDGGGAAPSITESTVTGSGTARWWGISSTGDTARIRMTVESYSRVAATTNQESAFYDTNGEVYNTSITPESSFEPEVHDSETGVSAFGFTCPMTSLDGAVAHSFSIFVEAWDEDPDPPEPPMDEDCDCTGGPEPTTAGFTPETPPTPSTPSEPAETTGLPNCDCYDDTSGHRTLWQLRKDVMAGLGFVDLLANGPQKTLCQMRCSVEGALDLGASAGTATRTLAQIRTELTNMLGFAANPSAPPGFNAMLDSFINQAQQALFKRLEMGASGSPPAWMSSDSAATTLDGAAVQMLALAMAKAHYRQPDAAVHDKAAEAYLQGMAQREVPITHAQIDNALRRARYTVWNRAEALPAMAVDDDLSTIHFLPIELLAIAELKARLQHKDAELYRRDYEKYVADVEKRSPPDAHDVVTGLLQSAQTQLYYRYDMLRTERFYSWALVNGTRLYDVPDNDENCPKRLDPRKVTWVGVEKDDQWYPLTCGIDPTLYSSEPTGRPQRYEIRSCIEVWPVPDETAGKLVVKGHFGLEPFTEGAHRTTIDDELVYLMAMGNAKAHYRQPDANNYIQQLETHLMSLTAGTHQTKRYIPGEPTRYDPVYVQPKRVGSWP